MNDARRDMARSSGRIEMLLESLPYIREFFGRTVVIKYGGAAMAQEHLREAFARDVVLLKYVGMNPVIVHGGGPEITDYMKRLGLEVNFVQGLRVSDEQTVEVAKMVLIGKLNKDIVLHLNRHGQAAVGLCGDDGRLFQVAKRHVSNSAGDELDLGFVGSIKRVDVDVLNHIAEDYIPVVASVGADVEGRSYNVNADEAAGRGRGCARRVQGDLPDRRRRLAGRPAGPGQHHLRDRRRGDQAQHRRRRRSAAGCCRSSRLASRRSSAACARRTSSTGASLTRCCSSCSPTRASARR